MVLCISMYKCRFFFFLSISNKTFQWHDLNEKVFVNLFKRRTNIFNSDVEKTIMIRLPWTWHQRCVLDLIENIQWHTNHDLISLLIFNFSWISRITIIHPSRSRHTQKPQSRDQRFHERCAATLYLKKKDTLMWQICYL